MKCVCVCVCWCYLEERNSIERDRIRERYHLGSMELRDLSIVLIEKFLFLLIFPLLFSCFFLSKDFRINSLSGVYENSEKNSEFLKLKFLLKS